MIRVTLPYHLRNLAKAGGEIEIAVDRPVTVGAILDALEAEYPVLKGTIRDHVTRARRPFIRFFVCGKDISLEPADTQVPSEVAEGTAPFMVIGAIAGG
jgi:molybdopterin synthase sulfur carrier subunit